MRSIDIYPAIDIIDGRCVRLQQGDYARETVYDVAPLEIAQTWDGHGAHTIHIVDLDGARLGSPANLDTIAKICETVSCRCELGGGIRNEDDIRRALDAGIGRVILGTSLADRPEWASELLQAFSASQLVAGIDARDGRVATRGWTDGTGMLAVDLAKTLYDLGITQFIYTDIATDGMFTGPNTRALAEICDAVPNAQVTASGGIAEAKDMTALRELARPNLDSVIVGKALYDGRVRYEELHTAATAS